MTSIAASEAGTRLDELLKRVETGERIAITDHGEAVAYLIPADVGAKCDEFATRASRWRTSRAGLTLGGAKVRDLINEGRR
jgi:prevent-host-death family protein